MRNFVAVAACAAVAVVLVAAPVAAKTETVKGQIVDENCSMNEMAGKSDKAMPDSMKECAVECAKKGEPVALVTADGKVYRIAGGLAANNNAKLVPHMSHTVEITGEIGTAAGGKATISADTLKMVSK
jgi:hypothetical protein